MIGLVALAAAGLALRPGVYGDVRVSHESGDYDGIELRIPAADAQTIDLTVCEGGCSLTMHPAITRTPQVSASMCRRIWSTSRAGRPACPRGIATR